MTKKNIVLLCSAGMSTSLLVSKMRAQAEKTGYDCFIEAYSLSDAGNQVPTADVVMLGPQVRFALDGLKKQFPDKTFDVIEMRDYGMMNGEKVLNKAKELLGD